MLKHGIPWQFALYIFVSGLISISLMCLIALPLSIWGYNLPEFSWIFNTVIIVLLNIFALISSFSVLITGLNLSRSFFGGVIIFFLVYLVTTLCAYANMYSHYGLDSGTSIDHSFGSGLYFSVTTFTTLGYGDLKPTPGICRFLTSCEALSGMFSMGILLSYVWLWCQEHIVDKDKAILDGDRYNTKDNLIHRMKVRKLNGEPEELGAGFIPKSEALKSGWQYDSTDKEWKPVDLVNNDKSND